MKQRTWVAAIILAAVFAPLQAMAAPVNLILNGSFETGGTNWTPVESGPFSPGNCVFEFDAAGTTTGGFGAFVTPTPTDGTVMFMTDANQPGTCRIYQDIVVPAKVTAMTMSYASGYNFLPLGPPVGADCSASIDITAPTSNFSPIANIWSTSGTSTVPFGAHEPVSFAVTPGSTIRVVLTAVSCDQGPAGIVLFAGSNTVPALDDWAKAALVLLLAASALFYLRKRANR